MLSRYRSGYLYLIVNVKVHFLFLILKTEPIVFGKPKASEDLLFVVCPRFEQILVGGAFPPSGPYIDHIQSNPYKRGRSTSRVGRRKS